MRWHLRCATTNAAYGGCIRLQEVGELGVCHLQRVLNRLHQLWIAHKKPNDSIFQLSSDSVWLMQKSQFLQWLGQALQKTETSRMNDSTRTFKTFPNDWLEGRYKPWHYAVFGLAIPPFFLTLPFMLFGGSGFSSIPGIAILTNLALMALNIVSGLGLWRSVSAKYATGTRRKFAQVGAVLATLLLGFIVPGLVYVAVIAVLVTISNG